MTDLAKQCMGVNMPGPYEIATVSSDSGLIKHLCITDSNGVSLLTKVECGGVEVACVYEDRDAYLMAASPDLYAALEMVQERIKKYGVFDPRLEEGDAEIIEAAMKKARGE